MSGKSLNEGNNDTEYIIKELSKQIDDLRKRLPNGEITSLMNDVRVLIKHQEDMGGDISEMKRMIMDPEEGIIVRLNKNTEYRKLLESQEDDNSKILEEHQLLVKFKENVTRLLWLIVGAIIAILSKLFFFGK